MTLTVLLVRAVVPNPLVPLPSEMSVIVAFALMLPRLLVLRPTVRSVLSVVPAANRVNDPEAVTFPDPAMLASSPSE